MSAVAAIILLATTGAALLIAGAYVIAGMGVALLISGGVFIIASMGLAVAVARSSGIAPNG